MTRQRELVADALDRMGWETPRLPASLERAPELYFDSISRVDVRSWSRGRVALVGDAACGATLGGMGGGRAGKFLAPPSRFALRMRNTLLGNRFLLDLMLKAGQDISSKITLADRGRAATTRT